MILKQGGQGFLKGKLKNNSRTFQEHFKNISILFKNISDVENIVIIDFFSCLQLCRKKTNLIRKTIDRTVWLLFRQTGCHKNK